MKHLLLLALLVVPVLAHAQTGAPTSWALRIYQATVATPLSAITVLPTQVICNQIRPEAVSSVTTSSVNPTRWIWDDVANAGRVCIYDDATRLAALPDGAYEGTAAAVNASGSSPETAHVPFSRSRPPNPPSAPTGLLLIP